MFDSLVSGAIDKTGISKEQAEKRVTALLESGIMENKKLSESAKKKKFIEFMETQID